MVRGRCEDFVVHTRILDVVVAENGFDLLAIAGTQILFVEGGSSEAGLRNWQRAYLAHGCTFIENCELWPVDRTDLMWLFKLRMVFS